MKEVLEFVDLEVYEEFNQEENILDLHHTNYDFNVRTGHCEKLFQ